MRKSGLLLTLIFCSSALQAARPKPYEKLVLPKKVVAAKPGNHRLESNSVFYHPRGLKALLHIPRIKDAKQRPLVVYYHGTTRNKNAYKRIRSWKKLARKHRFSVLSVQNVWGLNTAKRDTSRAILDTLQATTEFIDAFNEVKLFSRDQIYVSGHSSGGFSALCVGMVRPDLFRGIGNFKGNYYQDVMNTMLEENRGWRDYYKFDSEVRNIDGLIYYYAMGGKKEARRVKEQMPVGRAYLEKNLGAKIDFFEYPKEGHGLSKHNYRDFLKTVGIIRG